uniref:DUF3887 domain-containing protein n=1 Tax=Caenorhabditis japonica TaxID=281687 RepID=A0A8R1HHN4_CAEJA
MHLYFTIFVILAAMASAQDEAEKAAILTIKEHLAEYIQAIATFDTALLRKLNRKYDTSPFALRAMNLHKVKLLKVEYVILGMNATMSFQFKDNKPDIYVLHIDKASDSPSHWTIVDFYPVQEERETIDSSHY